MNNLLELGLLFIFSIILGLIYKYLIYNDKKLSLKYFICFFVIITAIDVIVLQISMPFRIVFVIIIYTSINRLLFKDTLFNSFYKTFIIYAYIIIFNSLASVILWFCMKVDLQTIINSYKYRYIGHFLMLLLTILTILLINLLRNKKIKIERSKFLLSIYLIINLILMILFVIVLGNPFDFIESEIYTFIQMISVITSFISITIIFLYTKTIRQSQELEKKNYEYNQLKIYSEIYENIVEEFRKYKHDFSNTILPLRGYIDENNMEKLREYFYSEILTQQQKIDSQYKSFIPIQYIKDSGFKGLIISKMNQAINNHIKIDIEIFQNINVIDMNTKELCEVIGILFDNAVEAAIESKDKNVVFSAIDDNEETTITVANSFNERPDINHMTKKGHSTKGKHRGYGLYIVKEILEKYDHIILNTIINDNMIFQELIIQKSLD